MKRIYADAVALPSNRSVLYCSLYVALFFVATVVGQLFAFEAYPSIIDSYGILWMQNVSVVIAALLVALSVMAVPALLYVSLSPLMRAVSRLSGGVVLLYWLLVAVWHVRPDAQDVNVGLFGSELYVPQGWWLVFYIATLIALYGYVLFRSYVK